MLNSAVKTVVMVVSAAGIAALATLVSAGGGVSADPLTAPQAAAIKACTDRPWPYNTCVDTEFGKRHIRLISTARTGH